MKKGDVRISHQTENQKENVGIRTGTYISLFVLALEGVNSNPSSRERLFLKMANPRQDINSYVHGFTRSVLPRTGDQARSEEWHRTDGRPSVSKPYFTQTIYKFPDRLISRLSLIHI